MKLDVAGLFRDAWRLWKGDTDLLLRIAGPFLFLPTYALYLVVPPPPVLRIDEGMSEPEQMAVAKTFVDWMVANGGWYVIATVMIYLGTIAILTLYLDSTRPDLRTAFQRAITLLPRYLLGVTLISVPVSTGVWLMLLLLPGLWLFGRMMVLGPALVAERPLGVMQAVKRSWALTRGNDLVLAGFAALTFLGGGLAAAPFIAIDHSLRLAGAANPVVIAMVDGVAAAIASAALLAMALLQIAIYRRLVPSSGT